MTTTTDPATLSRTAAYRVACKHVRLVPHGDQWQVICPWRELDGPTTSTHPTDYHRAVDHQADIRLSLALELMGYDPQEYRYHVDYWTDKSWGVGSTPERLRWIVEEIEARQAEQVSR